MTNGRAKERGRERAHDPVDAALDALRAEHGLEWPSARLERRLVAVAESGWAGSSRVRPSLRAAAAALALLSLAGLTLGGTIGFDALRRWWVRVTVDGREARETIDGEGVRTLDYTTDDGVRVRVRVERRAMPNEGRSTFVELREEGRGVVEEEVHEFASGPLERMPERFAETDLNAPRLLHRWRDAAGSEWQLVLDRDEARGGSRLMRARVGEGADGGGAVAGSAGSAVDVTDVGNAAGGAAERPYELLVCTAVPIEHGGEVRVVEDAGGRLEVTLSNGRGWELALCVGGEFVAADGRGEPVEFTTPSGRVKVQVGDAEH